MPEKDTHMNSVQSNYFELKQPVSWLIFCSAMSAAILTAFVLLMIFRNELRILWIILFVILMLICIIGIYDALKERIIVDDEVIRAKQIFGKQTSFAIRSIIKCKLMPDYLKIYYNANPSAEVIFDLPIDAGAVAGEGTVKSFDVAKRSDRYNSLVRLLKEKNITIES